jgi:hypothetical protein
MQRDPASELFSTADNAAVCADSENGEILPSTDNTSPTTEAGESLL